MEAYNVIGVIMFENRGLAAHYGAALTSFHARTSTLPFKAMLLGRVRLGRGELPRFAVVGSIAFTILVGWLHAPILERLIYALPTFASLR
jgi:uncharacterized membrane protein